MSQAKNGDMGAVIGLGASVIAKVIGENGLSTVEGGVAKTVRRLLAKQIIGSAILSAASKFL